VDDGVTWPQVGAALTSVQVPTFHPKQGYSIPDSTDGESKPSDAATDDHEIIKSLAVKLQASPPAHSKVPQWGGGTSITVIYNN